MKRSLSSSVSVESERLAFFGPRRACMGAVRRPGQRAVLVALHVAAVAWFLGAADLGRAERVVGAAGVGIATVGDRGHVLVQAGAGVAVAAVLRGGGIHGVLLRGPAPMLAARA
ncbi:hypothetical protein [Lysobacter sp. HA35]